MSGNKFDLKGKTATFKDHKGNQYQGKFIEFGVDYEESETRVGNFTIAIFLMDDGAIQTTYKIDSIKFEKAAKENAWSISKRMVNHE